MPNCVLEIAEVRRELSQVNEVLVPWQANGRIESRMSMKPFMMGLFDGALSLQGSSESHKEDETVRDDEPFCT
jgi:hypothetical protein